MGMLERLPNGVPAKLGEFVEALNGLGGMEPVAPALQLVNDLRVATCGTLFWDMEQRHVSDVMRARRVSAITYYHNYFVHFS